MNCPNQPDCALAQALRTTPALRVWQILYCESGFHGCERLKLLRSGSPVPANLMPNGSSLGARAARPAAGAARRP
ncbi:MAG TPA: hypothetical protein VFI16_10540 [Anaeromyxobacteraceae bacterium]|nr:hypothetical protein [Anaeromyxobacteraceae bacterium]